MTCRRRQRKLGSQIRVAMSAAHRVQLAEAAIRHNILGSKFVQKGVHKEPAALLGTASQGSKVFHGAQSSAPTGATYLLTSYALAWMDLLTELCMSGAAMVPGGDGVLACRRVCRMCVSKQWSCRGKSADLAELETEVDQIFLETLRSPKTCFSFLSTWTVNCIEQEAGRVCALWAGERGGPMMTKAGN